MIGSIILFVSIMLGKAGTRFGTPALLLFLLAGMLFGTDGVGIEFNNPSTAQFIGMVALSIILFSGGLDTKLSEIRPIASEGVILATLGVLLTAGLTGGFIYGIAGLFGLKVTLAEALLLASVMSSTDSASVFSILRSKKMGLKYNLRPMLELESGSNDPMAYILTILLIQVIQSGHVDVGGSVLMFFIQMTVGALSGYLLGVGAVRVLNGINIQNKSLYSVLLLAFVFFIFSFTDLIRGNGYLAVYIAGLVVGNRKVVYKRNLMTFFDGFTWLFQIVMFISLGLLVNPRDVTHVVEIGLLVGFFLILIARPAAVLACLLPFRKLPFKAKLYVSWVGLRGAVPIIFATYPLVAGVENASLIFNTVFFITIISLIVQGTTVGWMAEKLGLNTKVKEHSFDIDLPDEVKASLVETEVDDRFLNKGHFLRQIPLPENTLVMMVRRGDNYIVPRGDTRLMRGDKLLCISSGKQVPDKYAAGSYRPGRKRRKPEKPDTAPAADPEARKSGKPSAAERTRKEPTD